MVFNASQFMCFVNHVNTKRNSDADVKLRLPELKVWSEACDSEVLDR